MNERRSYHENLRKKAAKDYVNNLSADGLLTDDSDKGIMLLQSYSYEKVIGCKKKKQHNFVSLLGEKRHLAVLDVLLLAEKNGLIDSSGILSELMSVTLAVSIHELFRSSSCNQIFFFYFNTNEVGKIIVIIVVCSVMKGYETTGMSMALMLMQLAENKDIQVYHLILNFGESGYCCLFIYLIYLTIFKGSGESRNT